MVVFGKLHSYRNIFSTLKICHFLNKSCCLKYERSIFQNVYSLIWYQILIIYKGLRENQVMTSVKSSLFVRNEFSWIWCIRLANEYKSQQKFNNVMNCIALIMQRKKFWILNKVLQKRNVTNIQIPSIQFKQRFCQMLGFNVKRIWL